MAKTKRMRFPVECAAHVARSMLEAEVQKLTAKPVEDAVPAMRRSFLGTGHGKFGDTFAETMIQQFANMANCPENIAEVFMTEALLELAAERRKAMVQAMSSEAKK